MEGTAVSRRPSVIAHRGGTGLRPENTLAAFGHALEIGADGFELDVHLTADGELAVHHDFALKKGATRDPQGRWLSQTGALVKDLAFEELARYDVGRLEPESRYAARFSAQQAVDRERIPKLADVIELIQAGTRPDTALWIELKTSPLDPAEASPPERLAEAVVAELARTRFRGPTCLLSFDWNALVHARKLAPELETVFTTYPSVWLSSDETAVLGVDPRLRRLAAGAAPWTAGFDPHRYGGSVCQAIRAAGGDWWFPYFGDVDAASMTEARACGLRVATWTVNKLDDMRRLIALGVESITTDYPDRLLRLLGETEGSSS